MNGCKSVSRITAVALSLATSSFAFAQSARCPETIMAGGQTVNIGADIRRAGGPGPALQQMRQTERQFRAQNGDCSRFMQQRESYQACRIYKDGIEAALRAIEACAVAEVAQRMQQSSNAGSQAATNRQPTSNPRDTEAELRNEAGALRDSLNRMDASDTLASAAEALNGLMKPPPFAVKDPSLNYAGESCSYFTRPVLREDGAGINSYADGAMVCYGNRMYECVNRRWIDRHDCKFHANGQVRRAELLEAAAPGPQTPSESNSPSGNPSPLPSASRSQQGGAPVPPKPAAQPPATATSSHADISVSPTAGAGRQPVAAANPSTSEGRAPPAPAASTQPEASDPATVAPPVPRTSPGLLYGACVQMTKSEEVLGPRVVYRANFLNHCNQVFTVIVLEANGHRGEQRIDPRGRASYSCEDRTELEHRNCGGIRGWDFAP